MYKNITLVAFISAFMLSACGGGGSSTVPTDPTGNGASSKSSLTAASSQRSLAAASSKASVASSSLVSSAPVAMSSMSAAAENFSSLPAVASSSVAASSTGVLPVASSSLAASSVIASSAAVSSLVASSVKSSSSALASSVASSVIASSAASSVKSSSSIALSSSSIALSSSSASSSGPASIYHVRGSFNGWNEGTLMSATSTANVYELCVNFVSGDAGGAPRFKIDPNGAWGDGIPSSDYVVAVGWVKISFNSVTKAITAQQNLPANCAVATASSSAIASSSVQNSSVIVASSSIKNSSSIATASSVKSSSSIASSSIVPSSSSVAASSIAPSSSSVAASSLSGHYAGEDCLSCHVAGGKASKKIFTIAGTVYKAANTSVLTSDSPVHTGATIVIMDKDEINEVIRVQTDANGNFYSEQSFGGLAIQDLHPSVYGTAGATRSMGGVPTTGSCNVCHNRTVEREIYETVPIYIK